MPRKAVVYLHGFWTEIAYDLPSRWGERSIQISRVFVTFHRSKLREASHPDSILIWLVHVHTVLFVEGNSQPPLVLHLLLTREGVVGRRGGRMKQQEKYLSYTLNLPVMFGKSVDQLADVWGFVCTVCQHMTLGERYPRSLEYALDIVYKNMFL